MCNLSQGIKDQVWSEAAILINEEREKIIVEEREKREKELAEEREKREKELEQAKEREIKSAIEFAAEFGATRKLIIEKIIGRFNMNASNAENYVTKYYPVS